MPIQSCRDATRDANTAPVEDMPPWYTVPSHTGAEPDGGIATSHLDEPDLDGRLEIGARSNPVAARKRGAARAIAGAGGAVAVALLAFVLLPALIDGGRSDDGGRRVSTAKSPTNTPAPRAGDGATTRDRGKTPVSLASAHTSGGGYADSTHAGGPSNTGPASSGPGATPRRGAGSSAAPVAARGAKSARRKAMPSKTKGDGGAASRSAVTSHAAASHDDGGTPSAPNRLRIVFNERCWIRVRDANGKRLLGGVFTAGETRSVTGATPYSLDIGNTKGVEMSLGGQAVNLASHSQDDVAQFTLAARGNG